jgi:hypothetical protein
VGGLPPELAAELRDRLSLRRAIETGTYRGGGTRLLAGLVRGPVTTIELSPPLAAAATEALADLPEVTVRQGDSRTVLPELIDPDVPTLYWLDGHWSGGETAGEASECPLIDELRTLGGGHPDDAILVDDARLFTASPPPPHDPAEWPTIVEVFDTLRAARPGHHVTVLRDLIVAVPVRARDLVDRFGRGELDAEPEPEAEPTRVGRLLQRVKR